ncbi:MAG: rhomboid family intramembrane serine protease, partial [Crocinitomicaceae bacterium]|nr:rhomboid family intramembrane serine protease [Crocinitomicaceae bacterium]
MKKGQSIPWFTFLIASLCVGMYFWQYYLKLTDHFSAEKYEQLGAPTTLKLYQGQYWGICFNSFLHTAWQLLIFNLIGILYLGSYIERRTNFITLFILGLLASILTSIVQFTLTDNAGIGMTGVNYFLLSYISARSFKDESFKMEFRNPLMIVGLAFIALFIFTNWMTWTNFGVRSMIAGLVFGSITGFLVGARYKMASYSFVFISLIGLSSTLLYAPWSMQWNLYMAHENYNNDNFKKAKYYYNETLLIDPDNSISKDNLLIIEIEELSDKAFSVHENNEYVKAHKIYDEILKLEPGND